MKKRLLPSVFFLAFYCTVAAQVWAPKAVGVLPANYSVADICVVNEQVIWATAVDWSAGQPVPAGFVSKLMKSTDGGETWIVKDIEEAAGRFCWDIHAFDENTACLTSTNRGTGGKRGIFRTSDGGETWIEVFNHTAGSTWLHFFDGQEGLCGNNINIARTADGGLSWALVPSANIPGLLSGEITGGAALSNMIGTFGNSVWFGTNKARMYKTENRGLNWTVHNTGLGVNTFLGSYGFTDEKNGLGIFDHPGGSIAELAKTTDGGLSWVKTGNLNLSEVDAIPCANSFIGISYPPNPGASISTDLGSTWVERDTAIEGTAPVFLNPTIGWMATVSAAGAGPALYKWAGGSLDTRIYVNKNAGGANTGASWADAYNNLQAALAAAQEGAEIWVAQGTYTPSAPGGSQTATFLINKNLNLYGGFAGTECYLPERNIELYPTILSGDLNGNDVAGDLQTNRADNSAHVLRINTGIGNQMLLDGFTLRGGHADGSGGQVNGGGLYSFGAPVIRNCIFEQNYAASSGGGLYFNGNGANGARVEHCRIEKNRAESTFDAGGGLYIRLADGTGIFVDHCVFSENTVASRGAGIACYQSNLTVTNSLFSENINDEQGGGLWFWPGNTQRTLTVDSCTFEKNHASFGGGLYASMGGNGSVSITRSTFDDN
ncbi:MAG: hypothetical protein JNK89_03430, partial [Saprospiraceae bacterium]|nr:hypothetical protein [Saprospiraceae bacterium]